MDPNKLLEELIALCMSIKEDVGRGDTDLYDILLDIRDKVMDLDNWLCEGGFYPARWRSVTEERLNKRIAELEQEVSYLNIRAAETKD